MAAILKTFAGLNFYTRTCFIDYYHISFKKSHQTLRPRSCRVNQNFDISWILDLGLSSVSHLTARVESLLELWPCCDSGATTLDGFSVICIFIDAGKVN